uniref:Uncharacterized protein n=1 Tax=Globisporangium ultimum (strain ATCC 200006 / CBS 805.95 / DAOM BR144) TaxID=431595 RepID=K3WEQ9_GLOUD
MESKGADDRFYTPRNSARHGYSSTGSEDERFASSRESARSISSDDNEYVTPRESLALPTESYPGAMNESKRFPGVSEMKHALPDYGDPKYELKLQRSSSAKENYLGLATGGAVSARASELRGVQYVEAPAATENDIFSAARHNRVDSVTYMLDQGLLVNSKDEFGNTILSIACQNGLKRMAKLALRRGVNINNQNLRGNTALHFCFSYGYGDTLGAYLISKGADTTIENKDGNVCYYGIDQLTSARK